MKQQKNQLLGKRAEPEIPTFETGLLVKFSGLEEDNAFSAMELKNWFKTQAEVQYVEFISGDTEGVARCLSPEEAAKLIASTEKFNDVTLTKTLVEGKL